MRNKRHDHRAEIISNIDRGVDRYIKAVHPWGMPIEELFSKCYSKEAIEACKEGFKYCSEYNRIGNAKLTIAGARIEIPSPTMVKIGTLHVNPSYHMCDPPEVVSYINEVKKVIYDFAECKHVIHWFFDHGIKLSTIRTYCPWVQSLVSNQEKLEGGMQKVDNLGPMLPFIRKSAATIANALLVPPIEDNPKLGYEFHFHSYSSDVFRVPGVILRV